MKLLAVLLLAIGISSCGPNGRQLTEGDILKAQAKEILTRVENQSINGNYLVQASQLEGVFTSAHVATAKDPKFTNVVTIENGRYFSINVVDMNEDGEFDQIVASTGLIADVDLSVFKFVGNELVQTVDSGAELRFIEELPQLDRELVESLPISLRNQADEEIN